MKVLAAAVLSLSLVTSAQAELSQTHIAYAPPRMPDASPTMTQHTQSNPSRMYTTMAEVQSLACLTTGGAGSAITYAYSEALFGAAAVSAGLSLVPFMAFGFAIGCSVGATAAPGLAWLYRAAF